MTAEEILRKHVGEIYLFSEHATQSEIDSLRMKTLEAMEIYASQQRTDGIREGFDAARDGSISNFGEIDFEYDTVEDYLNQKK